MTRMGAEPERWPHKAQKAHNDLIHFVPYEPLAAIALGLFSQSVSSV